LWRRMPPHCPACLAIGCWGSFPTQQLAAAGCFVLPGSNHTGLRLLAYRLAASKSPIVRRLGVATCISTTVHRDDYAVILCMGAQFKRGRCGVIPAGQGSAPGWISVLAASHRHRLAIWSETAGFRSAFRSLRRRRGAHCSCRSRCHRSPDSSASVLVSGLHLAYQQRDARHLGAKDCCGKNCQGKPQPRGHFKRGRHIGRVSMDQNCKEGRCSDAKLQDPNDDIGT
jgi:hypothetical protein